MIQVYSHVQRELATSELWVSQQQLKHILPKRENLNVCLRISTTLLSIFKSDYLSNYFIYDFTYFCNKLKQQTAIKEKAPYKGESGGPPLRSLLHAKALFHWIC